MLVPRGVIVSGDECLLSRELPKNERLSGCGGKDVADMFFVKERLR